MAPRTPMQGEEAYKVRNGKGDGDVCYIKKKAQEVTYMETLYIRPVSSNYKSNTGRLKEVFENFQAKGAPGAKLLFWNLLTKKMVPVTWQDSLP